MEKLFNGIRIAEWNLRQILRIPQKTVAPVVWRPSLMTSRHLPSAEFRKGLDEHENRRIDELIEEVRLFSRLSIRFPQKLSDANWRVLLGSETRKTRFDDLMFFYKRELLREADKKSAELRAVARSRESPRSSNPNSLVLSFPHKNSESWTQHRRVFQAWRLETSPILAVDCQFLPKLSHRGRQLTALQLKYLITENRNHLDPFRMVFLNYDRREKTVRELEESKLQGLSGKEVFNPVVLESGVGDSFGSEKEVIYLSPDAEQELETVDDDKVYVIGGIVDRVVEHGIPRQASLEAATEAGVTARRLPIDRFVEFKSGSKFLTLLAVADILREVNRHGDWRRALEKCIPVRNMRGPEEKSAKGREAKRRIHEFNRTVLRMVTKRLGEDRSSERHQNASC